MMKHILIALMMLTLGSQMQVLAQKKGKKDKKELKWDWDGTLSKNADLDNYLRTVDGLYKKVQAYKVDFDVYTIKEDTIYLGDKTYALCSMRDANGNLVSRSRVNWQFAQAYSESGKIIMDMTEAGAMSASAALTLPQLGWDALKFAKYVKGGPAVISQGLSVIKAIRGRCIRNSRVWKAMKDGAIEDVSSIGYEGLTSDVVSKLNECFYIKEINVETDMSLEDIIKHNEDIMAEIDSRNVLPEDKSKELNEMPDLEAELEKEGLS